MRTDIVERLVENFFHPKPVAEMSQETIDSRASDSPKRVLKSSKLRYALVESLIDILIEGLLLGKFAPKILVLSLQVSETAPLFVNHVKPSGAISFGEG
jgi:hypothetical protein